MRIVEERAVRKFSSVDDLKLRIPAIQKSELAALAEVGALNFIAAEAGRIHRRDALWKIERAARSPGPLFEGLPEFSSRTALECGSSLPLFPRELARGTSVPSPASWQSPSGSELPHSKASPEGLTEPEHSPLAPMTPEERLIADFRGTGMTVGPHPMAYKRQEMKQRHVRAVAELARLRDGSTVRIAGAVIARQRPGTAHGFVFLSVEDETGITNAIITPQLFKKEYAMVVQHQFLLIEGKLQNQDGVISVKANVFSPCPSPGRKPPPMIFIEDRIAAALQKRSGGFTPP